MTAKDLSRFIASYSLDDEENVRLQQEHDVERRAASSVAKHR